MGSGYSPVQDPFFPAVREMTDRQYPSPETWSMLLTARVFQTFFSHRLQEKAWQDTLTGSTIASYPGRGVP